MSKANGSKPVILGREQILKAACKTSDVHVPELGGTVRVRALGLRDVLDVQRASEEDRPKVMVSRGLVGEDGKRLFGDEEADLVLDLPAGAIEVIAEAITSLSKIDKSAVEAAKGKSGPRARSSSRSP